MTEPKMPEWFWQDYLDWRIGKTRDMLTSKGKEYADGDDRMRAFNVAQDVSGGRYETREAALFGMMLKHWISILDILKKLDEDILPDIKLLNEKFGDMINYLLLLEGSIEHKIDIKANELDELEFQSKFKSEPVDDLPF